MASSVKNSVVILIGIALNLQIALDSMVILTIYLKNFYLFSFFFTVLGLCCRVFPLVTEQGLLSSCGHGLSLEGLLLFWSMGSRPRGPQ